MKIFYQEMVIHQSLNKERKNSERSYEIKKENQETKNIKKNSNNIHKMHSITILV